MRSGFWLLVVGLVMLGIGLCGQAATAVTFDFDSGTGSDFEVVNGGELWSVGTSGPNVPISKPEDPLTYRPEGFVGGGIKSRFCLDGDFSVTVDFELLNFTADNSTLLTLNESLLSVFSSETFVAFSVLRFVRGDGAQFVEAFGVAPIGVQPSTAASGRYRISRIGDVLTGAFATGDSETFVILGSEGGHPGPLQLEIVGVQGTNCCGERANNPLSIAFDNLVVVPDPVDCVSTSASTTTWGAVKAIYR